MRTFAGAFLATALIGCVLAMPAHARVQVSEGVEGLFAIIVIVFVVGFVLFLPIAAWIDRRTRKAIEDGLRKLVERSSAESQCKIDIGNMDVSHRKYAFTIGYSRMPDKYDTVANNSVAFIRDALKITRKMGDPRYTTITVSNVLLGENQATVALGTAEYFLNEVKFKPPERSA